uniref:Atx10homo_assoc domain-containing protein n=1 Tax=Mesocestoides corti TaxID=53468 RepID=A0A5K3FLT3_MESCO
MQTPNASRPSLRPFYLPPKKQPSSAEIVRECRDWLHTVGTKRPYTPREANRSLFSNKNLPKSRPVTAETIESSEHDEEACDRGRDTEDHRFDDLRQSQRRIRGAKSLQKCVLLGVNHRFFLPLNRRSEDCPSRLLDVLLLPFSRVGLWKRSGIRKNFQTPPWWKHALSWTQVLMPANQRPMALSCARSSIRSLVRAHG